MVCYVYIRNQVLHEGDNHTLLGNLGLNLQVREEFLQGTRGILPDFRYIFAPTMEDVFDYGVSKKHRWLRSVVAARLLWQKKQDSLRYNGMEESGYIGREFTTPQLLLIRQHFVPSLGCAPPSDLRRVKSLWHTIRE